MHYYTTVKPKYELSKWPLNEHPIPMNIENIPLQGQIKLLFRSWPKICEDIMISYLLLHALSLRNG